MIKNIIKGDLMDFRISKSSDTPRMEVQESIKSYKIDYTKKVKDVEGVEFTMVERCENVTLEQLEEQAKSLQDSLNTVNQKIATIKELA